MTILLLTWAFFHLSSLDAPQRPRCRRLLPSFPQLRPPHHIPHSSLARARRRDDSSCRLDWYVLLSLPPLLPLFSFLTDSRSRLPVVVPLAHKEADLLGSCTKEIWRRESRPSLPHALPPLPIPFTFPFLSTPDSPFARPRTRPPRLRLGRVVVHSSPAWVTSHPRLRGDEKRKQRRLSCRVLSTPLLTC